MFEVGKTYQFCMIEGGEEGTFVGTVERYEYPLIKLADIDVAALEVQFIAVAPDRSEASRHEGPKIDAHIIRGRIINVTSPNFVSAVSRDAQ